MKFLKNAVRAVVATIGRACQVVRSALGPVARPVGYGLQLFVVCALIGHSILGAYAQTDIASTITTLNTYWTAAVAIGVLVLLWVVGRMLVHRGTRG